MTLTLAPSDSHRIVVNRHALSFRLFAPAGYLMATGTFTTMSELSSNIAHFLSVHPRTTLSFS